MVGGKFLSSSIAMNNFQEPSHQNEKLDLLSQNSTRQKMLRWNNFLLSHWVLRNFCSEKI